MLSSDAYNLQVQKRQRLGWYLFDFSSSVLIINGGLYFPQWIVIDNLGNDFWFNSSIVITGILLIATAPLVGLIIDKRHNGMAVLRVCSIAMFLATFIIHVADRLTQSRELHIVVGLICFVVLMYSYQLAIVYYNTLLGRISSSEHLANTSGRGLASGWLGGVVGVLVIYPFVNGYVPYFQPGGRSQAFLPAAIIFGLLTTLSLFLLRGIKTPTSSSRESLGTLYKEVWSGFFGLMRQRNIKLFLLVYLLFSDAMLTIQNNASIYLSVVMKLSDTGKALEVLLLLLTAALGGLSSGILTGKYGLRKTMLGLLIVWPIILLAVSCVSNIVLFSSLFAIVGFLFGATWSISRALFILQIPPEKQSQCFGLYSSFERFASIFGPLVWGTTLQVFLPLGDQKYRIAMLMMIPFLIVSAIIFKRGSFCEQVKPTPCLNEPRQPS